MWDGLEGWGRYILGGMWDHFPGLAPLLEVFAEVGVRV